MDPGKTSTATVVTSSAGAEMSALGSSEERERFNADELAIVLSHFDLGVIEAIQQYPRGSRRAPKALLRTEKDTYLLKRRARGKDDPFKVAFCHSLQLYLASRQFPLPHLVGTRRDNNSMLQWKGAIYEVFEFINGTGYDNSLQATQDAGKTLGVFHKLASAYNPEYEPPRGSYHASRGVQNAMQQVTQTLERMDPEWETNGAKIEQVCRFLHTSYNEAATRANEIGLTDWPMQIIHCDWHPGNMLFRRARVVGVIDYDAARLQQRVIDVANGALQFSILGGGDDASHWPDCIDEERFKGFLRGYDGVNVISKSELRVVPWLMIEALIAESVIPVAATGSFARMNGVGFMLMIERKVRWLQEHADDLANLLN
ncbi:MAG: phosphotransferase [Phycisphaeraceae bacterium]